MSAGRKNISEKKDWNTPPKIIELVEQFWEKTYLDPCSNEYSSVNALKQYTLPVDGLTESWNYPTIFVNPPYGRDTERKTSIYDWIKKGQEAYFDGSELIFLIPVATNTKHFKNIIFESAKGICFLSDTRLRFWNKGVEDKKGAPMACCLVYWGKHYISFERIFLKAGKCLKINNK